jgi:YfiH family protein
VLFADHHAGVVAAAHSGWRGALGGVLEATISAMESLGAQRNRIAAAIGPAISQDAYEVGEEFQENFEKADAANSRFFARKQAGERPWFNLTGYVANRLDNSGIGGYEDLKTCTYAQEERFFSYRRTTHRQEPDYGRQISAIVIRR